MDGVNDVMPRYTNDEVERVEMLSLFVSVAATIVLIKAYIARCNLADPGVPPQIYNGEFFESLGRVLGCCVEDMAVGLLCLIVGLVALRIARPGWSRRMVRLLAHGMAVIALVYLAGNVKLFNIRREFLRLDLFWMGGGFTPLPCVLDAVSLRVKLGFALVPLMALMAHFGLVQAVLRQWRGSNRYASRPAFLAVFAAGFALLSAPLREAACGDCVCDFGRNPHLVFLTSVFSHPSLFEDGEVERCRGLRVQARWIYRTTPR